VSVLKDESGAATGRLAIIRDISQRKRAEQARQAVLGQLVHAQEEERRRMAHELHDSLGQYLSALHLGLKVVQDACTYTTPCWTASSNCGR
jgi:signal transduction histidine kinase